MFIADDIAVIATLAAALAAGGSLASLLSEGASKTTRTYTNPKTGTKRKVKLDGALQGVDPSGTVGHVTDAGPDYGKPVGDKGQIISSDDALERMGIGSYDAVNIAQSMNTALTRMLNPRGADQIFKKTAKYGSMVDLTKTITKDPDAMAKYMESLLKKGRYFDPSKLSPSKIVEILTNPRNIAPIIQADPTKYKEIWDIINNKFPKYKIQPTIDEPWAKTKTGTGDEPQPDKPDGPETGTDDKPPPPLPPPKYPDDGEPKGPKRPESDKRDPPEKEKDKDKPDDEEPKKPKPPLPVFPDGDDVTERPINADIRRKMSKQQWYPKYQFGGQDLLRLTEVEKLEELKNYTLFDLVNPLLAGDEDNLLALQNKIQENRRFTNTYANPRPERPLPPVPDVEAWRQPFKSVYPVPYPMSLDQPQSQNYYDYFNNQDYQYLNKTKDRMAQGGLMDPDMQRVLNAKRDSFTATDSHVMKHQGSKLSLLEDIDSGSVSQIDIMMLRQ